MDKLLECAKNYEKLLPIRYHIIAGRKKDELIEFDIIFKKSQFYHLFGLHKLIDVDLPRKQSKNVYQMILNKKITWSELEKSEYVSSLDSRIEPLSALELLLDNNEMVFTYDEKKNVFSLINADFVLKTPLGTKETYLFLSKDNSGYCFCRSLFYEESDKYIQGQTKYKLLYKEKLNTVTGEIEIQYDKLKKADTKEE